MPYSGGQWVNWQDIYKLNQPQAQGMAQGTLNSLDQGAQDASSAVANVNLNDPAAVNVARGKALQAMGQLGAAGEGGLAGVQAVQPGHSQFDAALTGMAAGNQFQELESKWSGLRNALTDRQKAAQDAANQANAPSPKYQPAPRGTPGYQSEQGWFGWQNPRATGNTIDPRGSWTSYQPEWHERQELPGVRKQRAQAMQQQIDPGVDPWAWAKQKLGGG